MGYILTSCGRKAVMKDEGAMLLYSDARQSLKCRKGRRGVLEVSVLLTLARTGAESLTVCC